jgi:hypothetical protein
MAKKINQLARAGEIPEEYKAMIASIVNERIAELLADSQTADLQPFFESPEVSKAMRRKQHIMERQKWQHYFDEWNCLICARPGLRHCALGMCPTCFQRVHQRLNSIRRRHASSESPEVGFRDTVRLAQEALLPSIEKLAAKKGSK